MPSPNDAGSAVPTLAQALPPALVPPVLAPALFWFSEPQPPGHLRVPFVPCPPLNTCGLPCSTPRKPLSRCFGPTT